MLKSSLTHQVSAMDAELKALDINKTWQLVSLPPGARPSTASGFIK
jgi:hypothetical protein